MSNPLTGCLKTTYVVFVFVSAFFLGALKGLLVGPVAALLVILGNVGVILGLLPAHIAWTVYALVKTNRFDAALKFALLFALPPLLALWLGLSIAGNVLIAIGYGFFTPWVSTFEAFRQERESKKFLHCIVDGTWGTIKASCTAVRDFADCCYHSYPQYLKELREGTDSDETHTMRLVQVPGCLAVGLMGLIVEIPLYTAIAVVKAPYMLFRGWHRLLHDLVSREGPFLETACVPVAGLAILLWPLVVIGSVLFAIFSSFFIGLYGSVIAYQERSFHRGVAYVIAMVSEFDEYTNDWLYLREGSIFPKPRYRRKKASYSSEISVGASNAAGGRLGSSKAPAMLVPSLAPSRSLRETIQEVKMMQIWEDMMKSCEMRGRELVDANVLTQGDLHEWCRAKSSSQETIVGLGLPSYSFLHGLLNSIKAGSNGLLLSDGTDVTQLNRPQDRLLDWFFHPIMVMKEQIKVLKISEGEVRFLEKLVLLGGNTDRMDAWKNGSEVPQDALKAAQIQAISRRVIGMTRSVSKFPTYRRRFRNVVKALVAYSLERGGSSASHSTRSVASIASIEIV
ncbi:uncharacterized membrane protein At3g27390 [Magnolia sinica]|uniref:uncharacterized membrane protein At3g27390 n=1 Tax=Magnolia sinica TaxID=86752 RepID=UPI00265AB478|nr:uncharacterized membrane protein At3g27390 [Magnolia sinica]